LHLVGWLVQLKIVETFVKTKKLFMLRYFNSAVV